MEENEKLVDSGKELLETVEQADDDLLPAELNLLPLQKETADVVNGIVNAKDLDELKAYTDKFSLNMAKKNAVRVAKLQNLLDAVNDNAIDRFTNHPDEFSNKEILDYMRVVQEQITASTKEIQTIGETPMLTINNQKNEVTVNVNSDSLTRESKNKVLDAVNALLKQVTVPTVESDEETLYNISEELDEEEE